MSTEGSPERPTEAEFTSFLGNMLVVAAVVALAVVAAFFMRFWRLPISSDPHDWGALGDYIGGLLNPLFGIFSLTVLLFSLQVQRRALREAERQTELQEIQRLVASAAASVDAGLDRELRPDSPLAQKLGLVGITGAIRADAARTVREAIRDLRHQLLTQRIARQDAYGALTSPDFNRVAQGLVRLDVGLQEFSLRGGVPAVGRIYGVGFREAVVVLLFADALGADIPPLPYTYGKDAAGRLDIQLDPGRLDQPLAAWRLDLDGRRAL